MESRSARGVANEAGSPAASSAMLFLLLVTSMMASFAASLFGEEQPEAFGTFFHAFLTMWQIGSGDSWVTLSKRLATDSSGEIHALWLGFFMFHNFLANMVLINIIVAILLDSFLLAKEQQELEDRDLEHQRKAKLGDLLTLSHPLDTILEQMSKYRSRKELSYMICDLYRHISHTASGGGSEARQGQGADRDGKDGITFEDLRQGLRKLRVRSHTCSLAHSLIHTLGLHTPAHSHRAGAVRDFVVRAVHSGFVASIPGTKSSHHHPVSLHTALLNQVHLNFDDWVDFVESSQRKFVDFQTFDRLIREQLRRFTVRRMIYKMNQASIEDDREATLDLALKHLCTVERDPAPEAPCQAKVDASSDPIVVDEETDRDHDFGGGGGGGGGRGGSFSAQPVGAQARAGWKRITVDFGGGLVLTIAVEAESSVADALVSA